MISAFLKEVYIKPPTIPTIISGYDLLFYHSYDLESALDKELVISS